MLAQALWNARVGAALALVFGMSLVGGCRSSQAPDPDPTQLENPKGSGSEAFVATTRPEVLPNIPCPTETTRAEEALDAAEQLFESADIKAALGCANLAADLAPRAVAAYHLRGSALATLGHTSAAQVSFAMALALDPDDPETLAAVSDFYISVNQPRTRSQLLLGLEYAKRGNERASIRRRSDRGLRARLMLLAAEAFNDLGSAEKALERVTTALSLSPGWLEAEHELGVTLFNLCQFEKAKTAFEKVLDAAPDDPYAHFYMGLISEYDGNEALAAEHFSTSQKMAPREFTEPVSIDDEAFSRELAKAIAELSPNDSKLLESIKVEVFDLPDMADLTAARPPFAPTIMGLYRGLPVGVEANTQYSFSESSTPNLDDTATDAIATKGETVLPRAIVLYRRNIARVSTTREELNKQIRRTLAHELGHAKGMTEAQLRRVGLE